MLNARTSRCTEGLNADSSGLRHTGFNTRRTLRLGGAVRRGGGSGDDAEVLGVEDVGVGGGGNGDGIDCVRLRRSLTFSSWSSGMGRSG